MLHEVEQVTGEFLQHAAPLEQAVTPRDAGAVEAEVEIDVIDRSNSRQKSVNRGHDGMKSHLESDHHLRSRGPA